MAGAKVVISGEDKTKSAFDSVKRGLVGVVDASGKASGSMERFLKLSPQMIAIGAAGAGVAVTFRSIYRNSAELQSASSELGASWKALTSELGKTEAAKSAASALLSIAAAFDSLKKSIESPPNQSWLENQTAQINVAASEIDRVQQQILQKRDNPLAFWLPSESELQTKLAALETYIVSASRSLNENVAKNGRPMDAFNPKQFTDSEWSEIQGKSARAYDAMKAASKDKADSEKADIDRSQEAAKEMAAQYLAVYTATRTPQEEFNDELSRANRLFQELGDVDIYSRQIGAAREKLGSVSASDPVDAKSRDSFLNLQTSLQTEEETIAASYERRQFIVEDALQRGLINEQGYNELSTQIWADNEAQKTRLTEEGINQRIAQEQTAAQIIQQSQEATFNAIGNLFGVFAGKSKSAALAQMGITKGYAIFEILARSKVAAAMAIGPPLGPVAGAPLAASITAWGYANAAAVGVAGIAQAIQINKGSFNGGGGGAGGGGGGGGDTQNNAPTGPGSSGRTLQFTIVGEFFSGETFRDAMEKTLLAYNRGDTVVWDYDSRQAQVIRGEAA